MTTEDLQDMRREELEETLQSLLELTGLNNTYDYMVEFEIECRDDDELRHEIQMIEDVYFGD